jgi:hypothetical protein
MPRTDAEQILRPTGLMNSNKRKHVRRTVMYPGQIDLGDGSPLRECKLQDASAEGALLGVEAPKDLPDEFTLVLGYDGTARRRCKVAWRSEDQVGVAFLMEPKIAKDAAPPSQALKPPAKTATGKAPAEAAAGKP